MSRSKKVIIKNTTTAGIHKLGYLTGNKNETERGTRHEIITYNSIEEKPWRLWLHGYQFIIGAD